MNIWVIGRNYPQPENEMQGSFELEQAKMLAQHGENVCYLTCCLHPVKRIKGIGMREWEENGVKIYTYSSFFPPRIYPIYCNRLRNRCWSKLLNLVKNRNGLPDIIHIHYPAMLMISDTLESFKEEGVKIVATEHWTKVLAGKLDSIELKQYRKYEKTVDTFICVGAPLAETVQKIVKIKTVIIPNVVNSAFKPSYENHNGYIFIAVGRLEKVKQFDKIIQAFSDCFNGVHDARLLIIGDGSEKGKLEKQIHNLNLDKQVTLLGALDREATANYVSNADCLICYSRLETFGVPIIEAWACGIPTISTTAAAVIDNFDSRLGLEISPDDFEGLKMALIRLYENRGSYDKNFIAKYASDHFSYDVITDQLLSIYESDEL